MILLLAIIESTPILSEFVVAIRCTDSKYIKKSITKLPLFQGEFIASRTITFSFSWFEEGLVENIVNYY